MTENYWDAYQRHKQDGRDLLARARWANADHLIGLAAECGLKYVMEEIDGKKPKKGHIKAVWNYFARDLQGITNLPYILPRDDHPFKDWDVSDRYKGTSKNAWRRIPF